MTDDLPTDLVPVLRHHLHETLLVVHDAYSKSAAEDLVEAFKLSRPTTHATALTKRLERSVELIGGYLGLDQEGDDVSEDIRVRTETE